MPPLVVFTFRFGPFTVGLFHGLEVFRVAVFEVVVVVQFPAQLEVITCLHLGPIDNRTSLTLTPCQFLLEQAFRVSFRPALDLAPTCGELYDLPACLFRKPGGLLTHYRAPKGPIAAF